MSNKLVTGESTKETVKPLRGECRVISGVTVVTTLVCFVLFRTRGFGRIKRPAFPAPSVSKGERFMHSSGNSRRGNAKVCLMNSNALHSHSSSPGLTGRPSIPETPENHRKAAAYWIVRSSRTTTVV